MLLVMDDITIDPFLVYPILSANTAHHKTTDLFSAPFSAELSLNLPNKTRQSFCHFERFASTLIAHILSIGGS